MSAVTAVYRCGHAPDIGPESVLREVPRAVAGAVTGVVFIVVVRPRGLVIMLGLLSGIVIEAKVVPAIFPEVVLRAATQALLEGAPQVLQAAPDIIIIEGTPEVVTQIGIN